MTIRLSDLDDDNVGLDGEEIEAEPEGLSEGWHDIQPSLQPSVSGGAEDGDDPASCMAIAGLGVERAVANPEHPWMKHHEFVLVKTVAEVRSIVDRAIEHGKCSLDLESQGLDTRIDVIDGELRTRHQIVGYCLSVDGKAGYYIPVRHKLLSNQDGNPNVDDVEATEAEIRRLCLAAQPVMPPDCQDPLGGRDWLEPPKVVIGFWHARFDQELLLPVTGLHYWHPESFEDFMLAYYVYYSGDKALGLKSKSREKLRDPEGNPYTMIELPELFVGRRKIEFDAIYPDEEGVKKYACSDAICTRLHWNTEEVQEVLTSTKYRNVYRIEKQTVQAVRAMERPRMLIDKAEVERLIDEARLEQTEYEGKILALAEAKGFHDFNPGSTKQLSDFLFTEKGLDLKPKPGKNEKSGQYKTDAASLEKLIDGQEDVVDNVIVWLVKYRQIAKIIGTYLESMLANTDEHDQLRFSFNQVGAATGRFTAPAGKPDHGYAGIPIHGIPARSDPKRPKCANSMRRIFKARPGFMLAKCDYSGQELRIAANVSREQVWIKEFLHGSGDLHSITARAFFGKEDITKDERNAGKRANFALVYGGGFQAIVRATGCSEMEGKRRKTAFDKSVPDFAQWVKGQHAAVKRDLGVYTAFGRWLAVPDAQSDDHMLKSACERYSTNYPIQGSGADIMKISMILLYKLFYKMGWLSHGGDDSVRMLLTVHDEVVFEIRFDRIMQAIPLIVDVMESPWKMPSKPRWVVPLIVEPDVGLDWSAKYGWDTMVKGRPAKQGEEPKDNEELIEGRIYTKAPDWLAPHIDRDWAPPTGGAPPPATPPAVSDPPATPAVLAAPTIASVAPPAAAPVVKAEPPVEEVVTCCLGVLTKNTAQFVAVVCMEARDVDHGKLLRLVDIEGAVLIDPKHGIRVDPDQFRREMFKRNLGSAMLESEPEPG